jgi:hypothetical protein
MIRFLIIISIISILFIVAAQEIGKTGKLASRPLFRDPVHDGAAAALFRWLN